MNKHKQIKILDGGSGFEAIELCKDKIDIIDHQCWSSRLLYDNKDIVRQIYKRFLNAGAELITSLSYQATPFNLSKSFDISINEAEGLMIDSVLLAKEEIRNMQNTKDTILVAASIGPYGAHLSNGSEYSGSYIDTVPLAEITEMYRENVRVLLKSDPDILAFETIPTIEEVKVIIDLMREYPNTKAWITMSTLDGHKTVHGDTLTDVIDLVNLTDNNIFGFGINCSINLLAVKDAIKQIKQQLNSEKVIVLYPNNGEQYNICSKTWFYPEGVDDGTFYDLLPLWVEEGASWIGGCCKMGSEKMIRVGEIINEIKTKNMF